MEVKEARKKLGPDKIIGVSARTVEQALKAKEQGADYLGVGAAFVTGTKTDAVEVGPKRIREVCEAVDIPVVAIGGITKENMKELAGTKIAGVALVSAIFAQDDIEAGTKELRKRIEAIVEA